MADSTIDQIKKLESDAADSISKAGQEVLIALQNAQRESEQKIDEAENLASPEIGKILNEAQKTLQGLKIKQETALANELNKIKNIETSKIKAAAEVIFKAALK